jgi:2-dehydro-3-deoxygluconokinase
VRAAQVALLGECMLELSPAGDGGADAGYRLGVAGDTFNTAVALARLGCNPEYLTGLGQDRHSKYILERAAVLGVGTSSIQRSEHLQPGLYMIDNDSRGERYFSYWRRDSAAHQTLREPALLLPLLDNARQVKRFYLSGISLALCEAPGRQTLWAWLDQYRAGGGSVIYDSNYRKALWPDLSEAREAHFEMLERVDIFLPGVEDELLLRDLPDKSALTDALAALPIPEVVLKDGGSQVLLFEKGAGAAQARAFGTSPVERVVDASGAGDAFNGAYLAARIRGLNPVAAVGYACRVAAEVIQHRGAILPASGWTPLAAELRQLSA